ncbi:MAG TPA: S1/P1 nuclease [Thermoanaerobaculia bacterium]|nr:S1/P1 nuclease [Thermoanaerobaculia bacterium]
MTLDETTTARGLAAGALVALATLAAPGELHAWGQNGHRIVGEIAERHLTVAARQGVIEILGQHESLAEAASWPDDIRSDPAWGRAAPWHFISIDDHETLANTARSGEGDVLEAMERFEAVLRDPDAPKEKKVEALRFYVHFVGDVHQPLHVGRRDDRGGNSIRVRWFREPRNLHSVWDSGLIESRELSFTEYVRFIDGASREEIVAWQAAPYEEWVRESFCLRGRLYDFGAEAAREPEEEPNLGFGYAFHQGPLVDRRLRQAGIRLAGHLNAILTGAPTPAPPEEIPTDPAAWCGE